MPLEHAHYTLLFELAQDASTLFLLALVHTGKRKFQLLIPISPYSVLKSIAFAYLHLL